MDSSGAAVCIQIEYAHRGPTSGKAAGTGSADPGGGTRYQGGPSLHGQLPCARAALFSASRGMIVLSARTVQKYSSSRLIRPPSKVKMKTYWLQ